MRFVIFPYKIGSASATAIRDGLMALGRRAKKVRPDGIYRYRAGDIILNWGNSRIPSWMTDDAVAHTLNKPHSVANASNKLNCFQRLFSAEIPTVPFTTDINVARSWNDTVYVRTVLNGHSGEGIQIVEPTGRIDTVRIDVLEDVREDLNAIGESGVASIIEERLRVLNSVRPTVELPQAPLYTRKVPNHGEYRVHVFNGQVIDYRKKSRHDGDEATQEQSGVRTLANGWIYRASNLNRIERVENLALSAIEALGLTFGAVDIIKDTDGNVYVLEINTACGMENQTLNNYINALINYAR